MQYYDHAKNLTNPAVAHATARARRSALADGTALRIEFREPGDEWCFWTGCRYDVRALARDLKFNGYDVRVTEVNNAEYDRCNADYREESLGDLTADLS